MNCSKLPVSLLEPRPENIPKGDSAVKQAPTPRPRPDKMAVKNGT